MAIVFLLIGCSVFVALFFLGAFFWASKTGQHVDTTTPAIRILFDDDISSEPTSEEVTEGSRAVRQKSEIPTSCRAPVT